MRIKERSARAVLVLGAGASRGAIRHVLVNNKRIKAPLNFDFFHCAAAYARAKGTNSADAKRLDRLKTAFKRDLPTRWPPPMETAFGLLYTAKDFPDIFVARPGRKPKPGERGELDDFLALLFAMLNVLDSPSGPETGYDRLASALERDDTVITLNYDTMLDSALARRGWNPAKGYAVGGSANKVRWRPKASTTSTCDGVVLLKLHGSVNWWVRGSRASLSNVFSKKPVVITAPRRNSKSGRIRQIIPPIYGKVFTHSHWRSLWKMAFDALCGAEILVVVGCSLIETDYHLHALLRRTSNERKKRGRFKEIVLVDRARIRRRWGKLFRGASDRFTHYPTFEQFLGNGVAG